MCDFQRYRWSLLLLLFPSLLEAEERFSATLSLKGGTTSKSDLSWSAENCFRLAGTRPILIDDITAIRFPEKTVVPLRVPLLFEIQLVDRQKLFGVPVGFEEDHLVIRTAWTDRLLIPRTGIVSIRHAPGRHPMWVDDFETDLADLTTKGTPCCREGESTSGKKSLSLAPGDRVARVFKQPVKAGRFGVNFLDAGPGAKQGCWVALEFLNEGKEPQKPVRVQLCSDRQSYFVEAAAAADNAATLRRIAGWHRLTIDFDADHILVLVDDLVLRSSKIAPGALRSIQLMNEGTGRGEMRFDDAALHQAVMTTGNSHPIDLTQDCVQG